MGGYKALHRLNDRRLDRGAASTFGGDFAERRKDEAQRSAGRRAALAPICVVIRMPGGAAQPVENVIAIGDGMDGRRPDRFGEGACGKQDRILGSESVQFRVASITSRLCPPATLQPADEHGELAIDPGEHE